MKNTKFLIFGLITLLLRAENVSSDEMSSSSSAAPPAGALSTSQSASSSAISRISPSESTDHSAATKSQKEKRKLKKKGRSLNQDPEDSESDSDVSESDSDSDSDSDEPSSTPSEQPSASPSNSPASASTPLFSSADLGACEDFSVHVATTATCAGSFPCPVENGLIGISPGTSITGPFTSDSAYEINTDPANACANDQVTAFNELRGLSGASLPTEMGGVTFGPGVWVSSAAVNIALANPIVYLDADGDEDAVFVFSMATTLITCAGAEIVLQNGA
jgi:hypothetical protein